MPFTLSHPAIVLPATYLPKKYYSLSGLIIGSMTPDFEYFIRMRDYSKYSHTLAGIFWFDVPLGLALIFIFHNVVRNTLIEYLPFSLNVRFSVFEKFNWNSYFIKNIVVVLVSLLVGIASHLFWDSFTHRGGYFAEAIPVLRDKIDILNQRSVRSQVISIYKFSYWRYYNAGIHFAFPEGRNTKKENILNFWLIVCLITLMVLNVRLYLDFVLN